MTGGLIQLVAYGVQDIFLTKDPQITFFKVVYRRHTNFSQEAFENVILENPNFNASRRENAFIDIPFISPSLTYL